jgi:ribosomal protein L5
MKEKKIGVSKVVIQLGEKEATLTVEQARELQDALNALLGEKIIEKVVERDYWYPYNPYATKIYYGTTYVSGDTTGTYTIGLVGDGTYDCPPITSV